MERMIQHWPLALAAAGLAGLLWLYRGILRRRRQRQRDFDRKLETVLQPKETVKVVCASRSGRQVLTSRRLLLETKEGFMALPFSKIKKIQGLDSQGKSTAAPAKMVQVTVTAQQAYTFRNTTGEFVPLVRQLKTQVNREKAKSKKKAQGKAQDKAPDKPHARPGTG